MLGTGCRNCSWIFQGLFSADLCCKTRTFATMYLTISYSFWCSDDVAFALKDSKDLPWLSKYLWAVPAVNHIWILSIIKFWPFFQLLFHFFHANDNFGEKGTICFFMLICGMRIIFNAKLYTQKEVEIATLIVIIPAMRFEDYTKSRLCLYPHDCWLTLFGCSLVIFVNQEGCFKKLLVLHLIILISIRSFNAGFL